MARRGPKPRVRYWASRGAYCCRYLGREHVLCEGPKDEPDGPTYHAAIKRWAAIQCEKPLVEHGVSRISNLFNRYEAHLKDAGRLKSLAVFRSLTSGCRERLGNVNCEEIKPYHIEDWLRSETTWNGTSKRTAYNKLMACLNWHLKKGYVKSHGLANGGVRLEVEVPRERARGREYVLAPELQDLLLTQATANLRLVLWALRETGARIGEIMGAEARHYRPALGALVFKWDEDSGFIHKTARKTRKDRVIFLSPELDAWVAQRVEKLGQRGGFIWRTSKNKGWNKDSIGARFYHLKRDKQVAGYLAANGLTAKVVIPYAFRHTRITHLVKSGLSTKLIADMMGTSIAMIEKHYSHTESDLGHLRALFLAHRG